MLLSIFTRVIGHRIVVSAMLLSIFTRAVGHRIVVSAMLLSIFTRAVGHRVEVSAPFFLLVAGRQLVADSAPFYLFPWCHI